MKSSKLFPPLKTKEAQIFSFSNFNKKFREQPYPDLSSLKTQEITKHFSQFRTPLLPFLIKKGLTNVLIKSDTDYLIRFDIDDFIQLDTDYLIR